MDELPFRIYSYFMYWSLLLPTIHSFESLLLDIDNGMPYAINYKCDCIEMGSSMIHFGLVS